MSALPALYDGRADEVLGALLELLPLGLGPQLPDRSAGFLVKSLSPLGLNPGRAGPFVSAKAQEVESSEVSQFKRHIVSDHRHERQAKSKMAAAGMLERHASPDFACAALPAPAPKAGLDVCPDLSH